MSLILLDLCLRKHKKYALYFQWFKWLPEIAVGISKKIPDSYDPEKEEEVRKRYYATMDG